MSMSSDSFCRSFCSSSAFSLSASCLSCFSATGCSGHLRCLLTPEGRLTARQHLRQQQRNP